MASWPNLDQHLHDFSVGAAVQRTFQRADAGDDGGVNVGERGRGDTRGKRRGVELVIRVQRERDVHRADRDRAWPLARQHVEKTRRVAHCRIRLHDAAACCMRPQVATRLAICAVSRTDFRYDACWRVVARIRIVVTERSTSASAARPCRRRPAASS